MSKTKADLIEAIMADLGDLGAGQPVAAEDANYLSPRITTALAELAARDVFYVANEDAIDDAAFEPLAEIMCARFGPRFGLPLGNPEPAEARLKTIARGSAAARLLTVDRAVLSAGIGSRPGTYRF